MLSSEHGHDFVWPYHDYHRAGGAPRFPTVKRPGRRITRSTPRQALTYALSLAVVITILGVLLALLGH